MTREALITLMQTTGIYFDPDHPDHIEDKKISSLSPPFLEFVIREEPFAADDVVYYVFNRITIRFYSDLDVDEAEDLVRAAIDNYFYRVSKVYDEGLGLWETTFTFTDKS